MLFSRLVSFISLQSKKYNIDSTHGLPHSLQIYGFARKIYESEVVRFPELQQAEPVITCAALLHDMCDGKYMDKAAGLAEIQQFLCSDTPLQPAEIQAVSDIVSTMSYSWVQKHGYPELAEPYMRAYHVVREADLLCSYDVDRCILFKLDQVERQGATQLNFQEALVNATELFESRMLPLRGRGYYTTEEGNREACRLEIEALQRLLFWAKECRDKRSEPTTKHTDDSSEPMAKQCEPMAKHTDDSSESTTKRSEPMAKHTDDSSEPMAKQWGSADPPTEPPVGQSEPVFGTECSEDDRLDGIA